VCFSAKSILYRKHIIFERNIKMAMKRVHYQVRNSMRVEEQVCNTDIMLYLNGLH
jgi:hypothetical protein